MGVLTAVKNLLPSGVRQLLGEEKIIQASTQLMMTGNQMQAFESYSPELAVSNIGGWRYAAMNLNASAFASVPIRLYVKNQRGKTPTFSAKSVDRKQKARLSKSASAHVRRKSAEWNDDYVEVSTEVKPLELLNQVNKFQDGYGFAWLKMMYMQSTGNAYWGVVDGDDGEPAQLWTLDPRWCEVIPSRETYVHGYIFGQNQVSRPFFSAKEIIHFKLNENPRNQFYGLGMMEAGWNIVAQDIARNASDLAFWQNSARPDYIVTIKGTNDKSAFERIKTDINGQVKGVNKTGRFLAIQGDVDFKPMQFAPKDMVGQEEQIEQLAAVFGVPVTLLLANDPNLASATVGYASWRRNTITSMLKRDEQIMNQNYLARFSGFEDAFLAYDSAVPDDETARVTKVSTYVSGGIMTPNEARIEEGLEPIEGGDMLRDPNAFPAFDLPMPQDEPVRLPVAAPVVDAAKPEPVKPAEAAPANATPAGLNGAQIQSAKETLVAYSAGELAKEAAYGLLVAVGLDPSAARAMIEAQSTIQPEAVVEPEPAAKDVHVCAAHKAVDGQDEKQIEVWPKETYESRKAVEAQPEDGGDAADNIREGEPPTVAMTMRRSVEEVLADQLQSISAMLEQMPAEKIYRVKMIDGVHVKITSKKIADLVRDALGPDAEQEMVDAFAPSVRGALGAGARYGLRRINVDADAFDVTNPKVAESLDRYTIKLAGKINQSTVNMVTQNIQQGLSAGMSPREIAATYSNQLPNNSRLNPQARSVVIARTETARAYVNGEEVGWESSGVVSGKRWLLAAGACPFCEAAAARFNTKSTQLGKPFFKKGDYLELANGQTMTFDYQSVEGAPLHPNCFPAGTKVSARGVVAAYRAFYSGKMYKVFTADGACLTVTPNHQLATARGFVAAKDLSKGDNLFNCSGLERAMLGDPDANNVVSSIEQVFDSLGVSGGMSSASVPVSPEYLHGDARFCNGNIDVKRTDRLLKFDGESCICKHHAKLPLCVGWGDDLLASLSPADSLLYGLRLASDGVMRSTRQSRTLGGSHERVAFVHGGGTVTLDSPGLTHVFDDGFAADTDALAGLLDRFPCLVAGDQVIDIQVFDFAGHVYDLQTETGVYAAGNLAVSNCRCDIEPIVE